MDESNKKAHHTDMYNSSELILRRGQSCRLTLEFNKPLRDWQSIVFIARTGPQNSENANTKVEFPLSSSWSSGMWSAVLESSPGNSLRIIMSSPANAVIGRYDLSVQISVMDQTVTYSLGKFILLFNPWCLDDDVYLANEDERQEYVLNDHGVIFMGNEKHVTGMGWNFGQFENNILNICLDILDRSLNCQKDPSLDCSQRHSPIYVGRIVSAMINSNDDYGVLEGKWEKDFSDGVDPNSWNGSVEILWQWKNSDYKPVKYGQCWVFAAVMCTVLRSLGIPTRVITNFNSAHNTDGNMVIDMYYDTEGKFLELSDDSIWNFHVWNESWFLRRDLGLSYSGWQVLDSTPQEESQGVHRCGPTSVIAVKEGDTHLGYDTSFVYAEVNADRETWVVQKDGTREKAHNDTKYVGQSISTKAVGSDARVDVTNNYKYPEGSPQERQAFEKASRNMLNYVPPSENVGPAPTNMMNRNRNDSPMRSSTPTPNADLDRRPSSPAPFSGRAVQPPSGSENRPASPSPSSPATERGRAASPARFPGRSSAVQPSESEFRPASPLPSSSATERGRAASPARFPSRTSTPQPSESEFRPASPLPSSVDSERGRSSSPARFPGRTSTPQPSESEFRPASPLPSSVDSERGRSSSPARFPGRTSTPQPSESEFRPASPLPSSVDSERRSSSPARFSTRTSTPQPSENDFHPAPPLPSSADNERGRSSSPARFPGRTLTSQPSERDFHPAPPLPSSVDSERGRSSSPARFPGRTSAMQPSESGFRPASPLPSSVDSERGRSSSPARYMGRTSTPQPPESEFRPASPAPVDRPSSPAMFSGRPVQPRSRSEYRPSSPSPNLPVAERGRSSSPVPFSGRPSSSSQPSRNDYRPGSPSPATPSGRPSSPAMYSGRPGYRPASPLPSTGSGRSSSPVPFSGRPSSTQPSGYRYRSTSPAPNGRPSSPASFSADSGVGYRPASPSPAAPSGRPLSPALFSGYPSRPSYSSNAYWPASHSPTPPRPSFSTSERSDIAGKFKLLSPLVVGDDINLLLILKNLTPYHRPVKVILSASCILYTGRRINDIFSDQKSLIISPNQDAHISLQIPYSHYSRGLNEGNMIQAVALCELPFGSKVIITKDLVLESPPIIIKPLSHPMLHKTMSLEIRFTNPLHMAVTDCLLVVEGAGLVDRQLSAVVPYLKPKEKIKFKVELTPYRPGIRQLIANFKCKYFSIKGYQLLNVESW